MTLAKMQRAATGLLGTVTIFFSFLSCVGRLGAQETGFQLRVEAPPSVLVGTQFDVTLKGTASLDLLGYAARLTYDPDVLSMVPSTNEVVFAGTVWEAADFLSATDDPATGDVVIGAILDQYQESGGRVVSAGGDLAFLNLKFQAAELQEGTTTSIDFSDDIDHNLLADVELGGHDTGNDLMLTPATIDIVTAVFLRGDCNGDGSVAGAVSDAMFLLQYNFALGAEPPCMAACDANGDGEVAGQVSDAVYLLLYSFSGGSAPPAPFPDCGPGGLPSDGVLGCESSTEGCQ